MCRATACSAGELRTRTGVRAELARICCSAEAGGQGFEPRPGRPKRPVQTNYTTPQRGARPRRYYDASVPAPTVVILAAGEGTRMRSALPKVLHPILGRPMILWPILAARAAGAGRVVVVDGPGRPLNGLLPDGVEVAVQHEPKGTGDAVKAAASHIDPGAPVLVINGDVPLITPEVVKGLADAHAASGAAATMATMELDDP